ncbi:hypothetical protein [Bacillus thuringiensis]|uniref:hypothetical protein n=1 Tax=Bacillus thuringiensis TaxID=1428 RepID=UPI0021D69A33|nr:hypothetical protein [Bacillus thuringiensis]MCU7667650.1 hypothetical protein [Bacillus thuringiensis]
MKKKHVLLGAAFMLMMSGCTDDKVAVESASDNKSKNICEQKQKGCYDYAVNRIEMDLKRIDSESIKEVIKNPEQYKEVIQEAQEVLNSLDKDYLSLIEKNQKLDSKTASTLKELLDSKDDKSITTLLKKLNGTVLEGEKEKQLLESITKLAKDSYRVYSLRYYNAISNESDPDFSKEIEQADAVKTSNEEKTNTLAQGISDNKETNENKEKNSNSSTKDSSTKDTNKNDTNKKDTNQSNNSQSATKSESNIQGSVITGDFKPSYSFPIKSVEGTQYKIHLISKNERQFTQDMTWAGAKQGDKMREGDYNIALQQEGGKPYLQELGAGKWTLNDTEGSVKVYSGSPDILVIHQREATVIDTVAGFYVNKGKVMVLKDSQGQNTFTMSFSGFKNLGNGKFMTTEYNNADADLLWTFPTRQINLTTGVYQTIDEKHINNVDEGKAYYNSNFK